MTWAAITSRDPDRPLPDEADQTDWVGFDVVGPEGKLGVVEAVQLSGRPARPLVLVIRDRNVMSLVSARRIRRVVRDQSRVIVSATPTAARPVMRANADGAASPFSVSRPACTLDDDATRS